jgi:hypothetical protein
MREAKVVRGLFLLDSGSFVSFGVEVRVVREFYSIMPLGQMHKIGR